MTKVNNELNPFNDEGASKTEILSTLASDQERAIQEVQASLVIAKKFPRNQLECMDKILQACTRQLLAEQSLYSYSRGGTEITGPSIRLAEAIAQSWGNLQFGIRELAQSKGESTVEAFAWDLETNTRQTKVFQVPHIRHTRKGQYPLTDPRDIYELVANQGARRMRNCILSIVPGDVVEAATKQCDITLAAHADISPEAVKKMVGVFEKAGVTSELIEERIGCRLDAIRPAQVIQLRKIFNSIRDGYSKASDWFNVGELEADAGPNTSALNEKVAKANKENAKTDHKAKTSAVEKTTA